jgi:hypothetical protein
LIGAIFKDAPHRNPGFQGKFPHFFSPQKLLDPFFGGVSGLWAIFFQSEKLSQKRLLISYSNKKLSRKRSLSS